MIAECLGAAVAHGEDIFDQFAEEFGARRLLISRFRWPSSADDFVQFQPERNQAFHIHREKFRERAGFVAHEKRGAFRRERIFPLSIFLQKFEADERVHDRAQTALRCACLFADLLHGFWFALQQIENFIASRCSNDQGRRVSEPKLHEPFGGDLIFLEGFHPHV